MMFDNFCIKQILDGEKTVTRRLIRNHEKAKRPAIPGKIHKLKMDRTKKTFGEILILSCFPEQIKDLTEEEARKEGFSSLRNYLDYFKIINNIELLNDDEWIWRVEFELINGRVK